MTRTTLAVAIAAILIGLCAGGVRAAAAPQELTGPALRIQADAQSGREVLSIMLDGRWQPVLSAVAAVHVEAGGVMRACVLREVAPDGNGLRLRGDCGVGSFEQRVSLTTESDVLDVTTRLDVNKGVSLVSVEDRYDFLPEKHTQIDEHTGPLDFVWSQNIKEEAADLIPTNSFKSPALMMQQGRIFAALMPRVNEHHAEIRALDLDVTSGEHPWMGYGAIPSEPRDHSYFRRSGEGLHPISHAVVY